MKILNLFAILLFLFPFTAEAQKGKSKAEKERQKINQKYFDEIFGSKDKDFEIMKAPDQWLSEPVVILCQKIHIQFSKKPNKKSNATKGVIRKRILIQDKSALEDFSEFYFQDALAYGIRHIKPDGTIRNLDINNAVKVETDVPKFYADSYSSDEYYKIAIPDLAIGDILDYYKVFTQNYATNIELINTISQTYPSAFQEIIFDVQDWSFFYNTFNGAPAFKMTELKNKKGKPTGVKRFTLRDNNREASKNERWSYDYLAEPIFKIMAVPPIGKIGNKKLKKVIDKGFSIKNVFATVIDHGEDIVKHSYIPAYMKMRLKSAGIKKMTEPQKVELIYNTLRFTFLSYGNSDYNRYSSMRSDVFTALFTKTLEKHKIEAKPVVVVPRYFGSLKDVVTENEMEFGVYVPATKQYYWTVDNYRSVNDPYSKVQGAEGYLYDAKGAGDGFKNITIPSSQADQHVSYTDIEITVNDDNSLNFIGSKQYSGEYKSYYSPLLLFQINYTEEDVYNISSEKSKMKIDKKKAKKEDKPKKKSKGNKRVRAYREELNQRAEELSTKKQEALKNWIESDFELEELNKFTVTEYGRFPETNTLQAAMEFSSSAYLKKAGPNLIFDVGKLITGQIELTEKEISERKGDIDQNYARTIENNISIILPESYIAQGLESLIYNVDNPYASFISSAVQEGNILTIKTLKVYKKEHFEKANWNKMVTMLEAAYDFSQKKIILKK